MYIRHTGVMIMKTVSYKPLFKLLLDRDITKAQLRDMCGYSTAVATKLNKSEPVSLTTILTICDKLDCRIEDVVDTISR